MSRSAGAEMNHRGAEVTENQIQETLGNGCSASVVIFLVYCLLSIVTSLSILNLQLVVVFQLRLRIADGDGEGRGVAAAMRDADKHVADSQPFHYVARSPAQRDDRAAAEFVAHFDVAPTDAAAPAGAEGLQHRLFRRPAAGIMLRGGFPGAAVFDFVVGVNPVDEEFTVPLNHLRDSQALDNVGSNSDNVHALDAGTFRYLW